MTLWPDTQDNEKPMLTTTSWCTSYIERLVTPDVRGMEEHEEQMVSRETLHHDIGPRKNNVTGNKRCPEKLFTMNFCGSLKAS